MNRLEQVEDYALENGWTVRSGEGRLRVTKNDREFDVKFAMEGDIMDLYHIMRAVDKARFGLEFVFEGEDGLLS